MAGYSPEHDVSGVSDPYLQVSFVYMGERYIIMYERLKIRKSSIKKYTYMLPVRWVQNSKT